MHYMRRLLTTALRINFGLAPSSRSRYQGKL
jgi:hypothetical protein